MVEWGDEDDSVARQRRIRFTAIAVEFLLLDSLVCKGKFVPLVRSLRLLDYFGRIRQARFLSCSQHRIWPGLEKLDVPARSPDLPPPRSKIVTNLSTICDISTLEIHTFNIAALRKPQL